MKLILPIATILGVILYVLLGALGMASIGNLILQVVIILTTVPLIFDIIQTLRQKRFGVDILALTSILGSLLLGETLAGAIIVLMLSGGEFLESFAIKRSRRELKQLLSNAPKIAHLLRDEKLIDVEVEQVQVGDLLLIKPGEVVPVDGTIFESKSNINQANITGESLPFFLSEGDRIYSGSIVMDNAITISATVVAAGSKYQQIVELVKRAEQDRAPFVRMADKYSLGFTLVAFVIAGIAYLISGDPVRALTVFVVATPCPLILATPIAFSSGISIGAKKGVIFKNGGVMEQLAVASIAAIDKTGTLTKGKPEVVNITNLSSQISQDQLITEVASLEQFSQHILASSVITLAKSKNLNLIKPEEFKEEFGKGISGKVAGVMLLVGKPDFLKSNGIEVSGENESLYASLKTNGRILIMVARDNELAGLIELEDPARIDAKQTIQDLKALGIERLIMLTGDKLDVANKMAQQFNINEVKADCLPEDKLNLVNELKASGQKLIMVGDGVNDAPALATADVGVAIGYLGSSASTETAEVIITVPELNRLVFAIQTSRRVLLVAKQGIFIGIGLSIILMILGAGGLFVPFIGAMLQELVDVAVILNALRVRK